MCVSDYKIRYRARLVVKKWIKKYSVETFWPIVRHTRLKIMFSFSVQLDLDVVLVVDKTVFLIGDLDKTIYIQKRTGFIGLVDKKVLDLEKSIFGLK